MLCGDRQIALAVGGRGADTLDSPDHDKQLRAGQGSTRMKKDTFRIVTRGIDGRIRIRDYDDQEALLKRHTQVGVDDCSTDLELRGLPVFRGLIGPIPEGANVIRYESPEVFETLTKQWGTEKPSRSRSRVARRKL